MGLSRERRGHAEFEPVQIVELEHPCTPWPVRGLTQQRLARRDPGLVPVLPDAFALDLPVFIVMHEDLKASARHRAVFDALVEGMGAVGA